MTEKMGMPEGDGFIIKESCPEDPSGLTCGLPGVNFSTFILSMYSSALVHLGEITDPATGKLEQNLDMAKQTIELLRMLEEKTRGNLDNEEVNLTKSLLHELRLTYVRVKG